MKMVRYLCQQPRTLQSLAVRKLAEWIAFQAKKLMSLMSELQETAKVSEQHDPTEVSEQKDPAKASDQQSLTEVSEQQDQAKVSDQQNLRKVSEQQDPAKVSKQQDLTEVSEQQNPAKVSEQQDPIKAETLLSQQIEDIRNYLECNVPKILHDILAVKAIQALEKLMAETKRLARIRKESSSETYIIGRMIETLCTKHLTCLRLDFDDEDMYPVTLFSKPHLISGLVKLHLSPRCSVKEADFIQLLKELHDVTHLSLVDFRYRPPAKCTDRMLRCIIDNCKLIEVLDLTNSNVDDFDISILIQLRNLKHITLNMGNVSEKGIKRLLLSCENIEHIEIVDTNAIALALENIKSLDQHLEKVFKLQFYENTDETTAKQMQLVIKMCPLIKKISLINFYGSRLSLSDLNVLYDLRELHLHCYKFYTDQVKEVLQERGHKLEHLHLHLIDEIDLDTLILIGQICPNLQTLCLQQCEFVTQTLENDVYCKVKVSESDVLPFRDLKTLSLSWSQMESKPSYGQICFLLSNCLKVEMIYTDDIVLLTDDIMLQVLDKNPLIYLKELRLQNNKVSRLVINKITENSISALEVITCSNEATTCCTG